MLAEREKGLSGKCVRKEMESGANVLVICGGIRKEML